MLTLVIAGIAAVAIVVALGLRSRTPVITTDARDARRDAARRRDTSRIEAERVRGRSSPWW